MNISHEKALLELAEQLDISPSNYKLAMERFNSMKEFLFRIKDSYDILPDIYLQGSFKLGTEVRPYKDSEDADYDIDIVCSLPKQKNTTSAEEIKNIVGEHLKSDSTYSKMLEKEGKRCWTLNYAESGGIGFHMDILPAIPELSRFGDTIAITNKEKMTNSYLWKLSNPKEFSKWFYERNSGVFRKIEKRQKENIFKKYQQQNLFASRNDVPSIFVKTPLQRAIQILKRHRDVYFAGRKNEHCKPISMIISVLSAKIYKNEETISETLKNILETLYKCSFQTEDSFVFSSRTEYDNALIQRDEKGKWHIHNPTCDEENFADKWHLEEDGVKHARAKAFFQWLEDAKNIFLNMPEYVTQDFFVKKYGYGVKKKLEIDRQIVPHQKMPPWPVNLSNYCVKLIGQYGVNCNKDLIPNIILPKNCNLSFYAVTDVPMPYKVYWQVVNTGNEAQNANNLRGGIFPSDFEGKEGLKRDEKTLYIGKHWIECFIVKDGICLACSGKFYVQVGSN